MSFFEVMEFFQAGKKIKRKGVLPIYLEIENKAPMRVLTSEDEYLEHLVFNCDDIIATDWEVVEE